MFKRFLLIASIWVCFVSSALAVPTGSIFVNPDNTIPGVVANTIQADGQGVDWLSASIKIDLFGGSVYNDPFFDSNLVQQNLWVFVPEVEFDTWFGIPGDVTNAIPGGGGDVGGGPLNAGGTGNDAVSVSWFTSSVGFSGSERIANISLTDDAFGSWDLLMLFRGQQLRFSGLVVDGVILPEPGTLVLLASCGLVLLRRRG